MLKRPTTVALDHMPSLVLPFPYTQIFFAYVGCFKLATLTNEMLINFPKTKFHLKAFSGQCTRLRAKLTSVRLSSPPPFLVAGEEGKEIFPGTLVHIVIHAFAALCVRSFMHSFMRTFVSLTSCLLCVGYCLGHKNTKAELSPAIVQCLPEEANAQLWWKCAPHTQVCTGRVVHSIIQAAMESCSDVDEALEAEQMWSRWVGRWG